MTPVQIFLALVLNQVAFKYAVCAACVLAPIYAFVLQPLLRSMHSHACAAAAPLPPSPQQQQQPPASAMERNTPTRLSTASSHGTFLSPHSVGASPLDVTPVFRDGPSMSPVQRARSGDGSSAAISPARSRSRDGASLPSLTVTGTAMRMAEEEYRSPTKRFVTALRRQVQQRGAAFFGRDDSALRAAVEAGEVYIHRPARPLPRQDYLALRLLRRQQQQARYDQLNITDASLDALYASPKFHEWYGANREQLVQDAQLRESFYKWRSLARAAVLLVAVLLLPAFSFSTETNAVQWRSPLTAADSAATVAAAPFAQILLTRMSYIQNARSLDAVAKYVLPFAAHMRADARIFIASAVSMAEWIAVVTAVCALVTSCFMPRGSRRTASVAFAAFLVVLIESVLVPGVAVHVGLGSLLIVTVVGTQIRRAAE